MREINWSKQKVPDSSKAIKAVINHLDEINVLIDSRTVSFVLNYSCEIRWLK